MPRGKKLNLWVTISPKRFTSFLKENGSSRYRLGLETSVTERGYSKYVKESRMPVEVVLEVCEYFGMPAWEVFGIETENQLHDLAKRILAVTHV